MPPRSLSHHQSVSRLTLYIMAGAAVVVLILVMIAAHRKVESLLIAQLKDDLTDRVSTLSNLLVGELDTEDESKVSEIIQLSGLTEVVVFAPDEEGKYFCIAASNDGWIDRYADGFVNRLEVGTRFPELMASANGEPQMAESGVTAEVVTAVSGDRRIYAAMSSNRITERMDWLWWAILWRFTLIAAFVGALSMAAFQIFIAEPLRKLRLGAEAVAARRDVRVVAKGPSEVVAIGTAIGALAADSEAERRHVQEEAERWRALFDKIPSPAFIFATGGHILEANAVAQEALGTDRNTLLQRRRDSITHGEEALRLANGEEMPVHWVEAPLEHDGRPATLAIALDLSSRREAEAQMKHLGAVLDQIDLMIFELDEDGQIEACNVAACRGVSEGAEALRGRALSDVFEGDPALPEWSHVKRAIFNDGVWRGDVSPLSEGETMLVEMEIKTFPPGGHLAVGRVVTGVRALESDLEELQTVSALGAMALCGTRDLRRSIQAIQTYTTHLADMCKSDPEISAGLNSIETSARRANELLRHQRSFSREEVFDIQPVDINALVQREITTAEIFRDKRVSVTLDLDDQIEAIPSEPQHLAQALRTVRDALRGNSQVVVTTQTDAAEGASDLTGKRVRIILHGDGKGLSAEEALHAFDPVHLVAGEDAVHSLPFAAGLIHLLGGEVTLRNEPGVCTTIEISLPVSADEVAQVDGPIAPVEVATSHEPPLGEKATDDLVEDLIAEPARDDEVMEELNLEFEEETWVEDEPEEVFEEERIIAEDPEVKAPQRVPDEDEEDDEEDGEEEDEDLLSLAESVEPDEEESDEDDEDVMIEEDDDDDEEDDNDEEEDDEEEENDEEEEAVPASGNLQGRPALLVIDDEEFVLDLVKDVFEDEEFEVITAPTGDEGLQRLRENSERIFMAVIDLELTHAGEGWEVARKLADHSPGIAIHVASGYQTETSDIPAECVDAVTGLVRKPFRAGALRDLILDTLESRR